MDLSFLPSLKPLYQPFLDRGLEIYLVGGAVRDLLLGGRPKDFDFTTDALPQTVQEMFRRTVPTGIKHGTVTVLLGSNSYEVTTFRTDAGYIDHRRPEEVVFTASLEEDLQRRDFTINGLALTIPGGHLVDFHGGQQDLREKRIRAIGRPLDRFNEDALRILRACRFAARLNFTIEEETWEAIKCKRRDVAHLSRERIREELNKTTACGHPGYGWELLRNAGLTGELDLSEAFPGASQGLEGVLNRFPEAKTPSRWALILKIYAAHPENWMKHMTFSNLEIKETLRRLAVLEVWDDVSVCAGQVLWIWGTRDLEDLEVFLNACAALGLFKNPDALGSRWEELNRKARSGEPVFLKDLTLQGQDIMTFLGRTGGPWLGKLLSDLQSRVWRQPEKNRPEVLREWAREWAAQESEASSAS